MRSLLVLLLGLVVGCKGSARTSVVDARGAPDGATDSSMGVSGEPPRSVAMASASTTQEPARAQDAGSATLVLQRVYSDCGDGTPPHALGTDVFVVLQRDEPKSSATKEFAFCSSRAADGGMRKPVLQIWQNCSSFSSCRVTPSDAGPEGKNRVDITCGSEHVTLESDGSHTVLRGSFGEREIATTPMRVLPVRTEERRAYVDC